MAVRILEDFSKGLPDWLIEYLYGNGHTAKAFRGDLSNKGVDLANATYISATPPRSNRDPIFKDDTKLCIYRLDCGFGKIGTYVYGYGGPYVSKYNNYADKLNKRELLDVTVEFGYIDLNDSRNTNIDKKRDRAAAKQGMDDHDANKQYLRKWNDDDRTWLTKRGYDKSGYRIPDPDRYVRMLNNVGLDGVSDRLSVLYDRIIKLRDKIQSAYGSLDLSDTVMHTKGRALDDKLDALGDAMIQFRRACSYYKDLVNDIDDILNSNHSEEDKDKNVKFEMRMSGKNVTDYINSANMYLRKAGF